MEASPAQAFIEELNAHGLRLVAVPRLAGAPWNEALREPSVYAPEELDYFVYADSADDSAFDAVRSYTTGGKLYAGVDARGHPLRCKKLNRDALPEGLDAGPYVRSPLTQGNDLFYPLPPVSWPRYHIPLEGGRHLLLTYSPGQGNETSLLDALERAGLFDRARAQGAPPLTYARHGGIVAAVDVPEGLMEAILRTEGNGVRAFSEVTPQAAGVRTLAEAVAIAGEVLKPGEKKTSDLKRIPPVNAEKPLENVSLQAAAAHIRERGARLQFFCQRRVDGNLDYLVSGLEGRDSETLRRCEEGLSLKFRGLRDYALPQEQWSALKTAWGETTQSPIRPAIMPSNFFANKYHVRFAHAQGEDYMYLSPKKNWSLSSVLGDLTSAGFPDCGAHAVTVGITAAEESPPVARIALAAQVAEDLRVQCKSKEPLLSAECLKSLDALASQVFDVAGPPMPLRGTAEPRLLERKSANGNKSQEPTAEERHEAAFAEASRIDPQHLALAEMSKEGQRRYYLLWRTTTHSGGETSPRLGGMSPRHSPEIMKALFSQRPQHLWMLQISREDFERLRQAHGLEVMESPDNVFRKKEKLLEFAGGFFNQRDREQRFNANDPCEAAMEHLRGRNLRRVNVVYPSAGEIERQLSALCAVPALGEMGDAAEKIALGTEAIGQALQMPQERDGAFSPAACSALAQMRASAQAMGAQGETLQNAWQEVQGALEAYRDWLQSQASAGRFVVPQLIVVNPNERTKRMLTAPQVQEKYMTRSPEMYSVGRRKNVMILYPNDEMMAHFPDVPLLEKKNGASEALEDAVAMGEVPELPRLPPSLPVGQVLPWLRASLRPPEKETRPAYAGVTAEERFGQLKSIMSSMGDSRPLLALENPVSPDDRQNAPTLGAQPLLIFPLPGDRTRRTLAKLENLVGGLSPFLQPRRYFAMTSEMPELSAQAWDYDRINRIVKKKQHARNALNSMISQIKYDGNASQIDHHWQMFEDSTTQEERSALGLARREEATTDALHSAVNVLARDIIKMQERLDALSEAHPEIEGQLSARRQVEEYEEQRIGIQECNAQGRVYTLDGQGYESVQAMLDAHPDARYAKLYLGEEMGKVCQEALGNQSSRHCFRNRSSNWSRVAPVAESRLLAFVEETLGAGVCGR